MANYTAIDDSSVYFQTKLYTGTGSQLAVTLDGNSDMQPDFIWFKNRGTTNSHGLQDVVRGFNTTGIQSTNGNDTDPAFNGSSLGYVSAVASDGFTVEAGNCANASSNNYVAWCWKAGTSFSNDASSTGVGTIDSSGSVNDTAGISICKWVGTGSNGTVKHGLTTKPQVILQKNTGYAYDWYTWHHGIAINNYLKLNTTGGATSSDSGGVTFGNTDPTTSVFSLGNDGGSNRSGDTHIAFIFSERRGYSKFGTYVGNGAGSGGGPYINLGFRPAFFLLKESDGSDNWTIMDTKRLGYNPRNDHLFPNLNNAEYATDRIDMLGNGIKIIDNDGSINQSGQSYVYYAFAENPLVTSSGVAGLAR